MIAKLYMNNYTILVDSFKYGYSQIVITTHDSELRGQEETAVHDE